MINFTPDQVNSIKEQVEEIVRIQQFAYKAGYNQGFEDGKKQATIALTKVYDNNGSAEFENERFEL